MYSEGECKRLLRQANLEISADSDGKYMLFDALGIVSTGLTIEGLNEWIQGGEIYRIYLRNLCQDIAPDLDNMIRGGVSTDEILDRYFPAGDSDGSHRMMIDMTREAARIEG